MAEAVKYRILTPEARDCVLSAKCFCTAPFLIVTPGSLLHGGWFREQLYLL